jgi:hypothetical protein
LVANQQTEKQSCKLCLACGVVFSGCLSIKSAVEKGRLEASGIGIWEEQLLVWMDGNKFLSLSVETGELLWEINRWEYVEGKGHGYYFGQGVHLDETQGKCYLFEGTCYMEIDLATQKATTLWQEDSITYGRLFGRPNFTPDYIYFLIGGVCSTSVGIFDRKILQIVWQHDFVFDQSGAEYIMLNQPPQVADNKLYVLDTGGTLHIFERTAV